MTIAQGARNQSHEQLVSVSGGSVIKLKEKIAFGLGDFSASLAWNAVSAFALYFYTDVVVLSVSVIGLLFLISRIVDAVFDIGVGLAVDRTVSRFGKARPYLLYGAVPFGLLTVMVFYAPELSANAKLAYACATYVLLGLLLSLTNIPYSALLPMMSSNEKDRIDLSAARSVATSLGVILATALFMPAVAYLGDGSEKTGFFKTALIIGCISTATLICCFMFCKERVHTVTPSNNNAFSDIKMMFRNRAWLAASGFALLNFVRFGGILALTPYFAINVLQKPWTISVLLPTLSGTMLVGALIARPILARFGTVKTDTVALVISVGLYLLLPFAEQITWLFISLYILVGLVISITMTSIYLMASESVDYHELHFGIRNEGLLASGVTFAIKVGMALGSALVAFVLAAVNYEPGATTALANTAMTLLYYGLPVAVFALQVVCIRFYPEKTKLEN